MLKKKNRLCKRGSFAFVYRKGRVTSGSRVKLSFVPSSGLRIGFSVGNKIGKAVTRNKIKRRLRAILYPLVGQFHSGYQIVFSAKSDFSSDDFSLIEAEIVSLLTRTGILAR